MIRMGVQQEIDDYFNETESVSQSYLKTLLKGVEFLDQDERKLYYDEKGHFIIGSGVDIQITQGEEAFSLLYHTADVKKPSDTIMSIIHMIFDHEPNRDSALEDLDQPILDACEKHSYGQNWKEDTRVQKVIDQGDEYWRDLKKSEGKQVISNIESLIINNIVMSFKSHAFTAGYFKDSKDIDIFYQVPIYFEYKGVKCKALLDMVIVNKLHRTVLPVDLKTMSGSTKKFPANFRKLRYDIQASFYRTALQLLADNVATSPTGMDIRDYSILPFEFIVETTDYSEDKITGTIFTQQGRPIIYQVGEYSSLIGRRGRPEVEILGGNCKGGSPDDFPIVYREINGWEQALELHKWHLEHGYQYDRHLGENNGVIIIND